MTSMIWLGRYTEAQKKSVMYSNSSVLFFSLLKRLKATLRRAKTITLIVDNVVMHDKRETSASKCVAV